jgi:hypothetical protein
MALKGTELLQHLLHLVESLNINIREESVEGSRGGLYILKGKKNLLINKDLNVEEKIELAVAVLKKEDLSDIYVLPAIRELLES